MNAKESFQFCPRCAAPAPPLVASNYFHCDACEYRLYFNVAVACAVFLRDSTGRALFLQRAREPAKGKLGVPGGFVDREESVEEAIRRETREEVGLEIGELDFLCTAPNLYPYRGITYPTVDAYFVGTALSDEITLETTEVVRTFWRDPFSLAEDELAFASLKEAMRQYRARYGKSETA